ncbi:MAG: PqqD family protein [Planctomycetia bacterium]|nr:PqqD family protein [Planctomycetia bacterium]
MDFDIHYQINSPNVISEKFDDDFVILNLEDGCYFSLEGAGSSVWNALIAGETPESIIEGVHRARPDLAEPTAQFLRRLCELKLVRPAARPGPESTGPVDWASRCEQGEPRIEVFDDLAELILADPIHDVDAEAGWPIRRAA